MKIKHNFNIEEEIEIFLWCNDCGEPLDGEINYSEYSGDIRVKPCTTCKEYYEELNKESI